MRNKASVWCYISAAISYIAGVVYCFSLIFLPISIYCFVFGNRYMRIAKLSNSELAMIKSMLTSSAVFISIFGFPIGLITIIPACIAGSNAQHNATQNYDNSSESAERETVKADEVEVEEVTNQSKNSGLSQNDLETIEKLARFRDQGLLSDDEFEEAKRQIINKK